MFAVAPTAKAARTVERDTGIPADTVAKLLHEWHRTDRPPLPELQLPAGATLIVDEAGMLSTPALHQLVTLADRNRWRLALVGDPRQLQGVGRGGLFAELCANGRVDELERLHRFTHPWEAAASLQLRRGDPAALDAYEAHGRIVAGTLDDHLARIAATWIDHHDSGRTIAVVASTNDHVDAINHAIQTRPPRRRPPRPRRWRHGSPAARSPTSVTSSPPAATTAASSPATASRSATATPGPSPPSTDDGSLTVSHQAGHGNVTLPADYVRDHVRLGYAATEHGWQSDTVDTAIALTSPATTRRGLYVAATRGRDTNTLCVVTDSDDVAEARDVLEAVLAIDRADVPATTQRRTLAQAVHQPTTTPITRCEIPDWFPTVLADAQRALARRRRVAAVAAIRRAEATAAAATADATLADVAAATADDRDALRAAEARAVDARRHAGAQHRLDTAPRRQRRTARHDLDVAEHQLERAENYLANTRQRTGPAVERHTRPSPPSATPTRSSAPATRSTGSTP